MVTEADILQALHDVKDPEIPTISVVELGIITHIKVENNAVEIMMTPTFSGCPAIKILETYVRERIEKMGVESVVVKTTFDTPWNTNRISESGRAALLKHGLAPPPKHDGYFELDVLSDVACPFCSSRNTTFNSPFGATLCRSIHYCKNCLQSFEQFKPVV
ncbi:MAG: phenylacetate-CoA oxygenase subunit PaaJ [Bacteroidetes bacterium]|nr:phenylacetate-CoA oxygenase subunit PaaJ [Bacteroidota bacterium]